MTYPQVVLAVTRLCRGGKITPDLAEAYLVDLASFFEPEAYEGAVDDDDILIDVTSYGLAMEDKEE